MSPNVSCIFHSIVGVQPPHEPMYLFAHIGAPALLQPAFESTSGCDIELRILLAAACRLTGVRQIPLIPWCARMWPYGNRGYFASFWVDRLHGDVLEQIAEATLVCCLALCGSRIADAEMRRAHVSVDYVR